MTSFTTSPTPTSPAANVNTAGLDLGALELASPAFHKSQDEGAAENWLDHLRLPQAYVEDFSTEPVLTTISIAKPGGAAFFRCQEGSAHEQHFLLLPGRKIEMEGFFVVPPHLLQEIPANFVHPYELRLVVTTKGTAMLLPLRLPNADGEQNSWHRSMFAAAELAKQHWVRVTPNMQASRYDVVKAVDQSLSPVWPNLSFEELVKLAFKDRVVDSVDHHTLKILRGEVL